MGHKRVDALTCDSCGATDEQIHTYDGYENTTRKPEDWESRYRKGVGYLLLLCPACLERSNAALDINPATTVQSAQTTVTRIWPFYLLKRKKEAKG